MNNNLYKLDSDDKVTLRLMWGGSGEIPAGNDGVTFRSAESDNESQFVTLVCEHKGNKITGLIEIKDTNIEKSKLISELNNYKGISVTELLNSSLNL